MKVIRCGRRVSLIGLQMWTGGLFFAPRYQTARTAPIDICFVLFFTSVSLIMICQVPPNLTRSLFTFTTQRTKSKFRALASSLLEMVLHHGLLPSSAQAQAQAQLGAVIALFSQLWGTTLRHHTPYTIHHTPYTRNSRFACLKPKYHNCGDLFMTH